ncbi:RIP metalloprotease RseP [Pararhizobium mangrovi]|uniref:Zinc metalloprotease n=1 Tax=Pararhizobium mangrovi TaxID=2590452 RepID=A0A506UC99_9HYPH|nr:RIP metalloprotease RseP [Pararhizobium mangrovi]TPW31218.1 RIP metalloprotease RseP [Pararhizobium mangrovi]
MDILTSIGSFLIGTIVPFLLVLTAVVFFHELGHYLVGRWCGIRALAFSVGFGPELIGWTDKRGTRWRLSAVPLGGYVRFLGDENAASAPDTGSIAELSPEERRHSLGGADLWRRAATVAAGPLANFVLAIAVFSALFLMDGRMVADPVVARVQPGSAAAAAGIAPGDRFVSIDGARTATFDDVRRIVSQRPGERLDMVLSRDGHDVSLDITPRSSEITDRFGNTMQVGLIGVVTDQSAGNFRRIRYGPVEALGQGALESWRIVAHTGLYIGNIFAGRQSADELGGPIRVAQVSGQVATLGVVALIHLVAVLSVSIGLLNLMPIPMLDGGHLVFYAIEGATGRPLGERIQEAAFRFGLALVLMLMVFATWNDVSRIFG